jgi:hypothetical protein
VTGVQTCALPISRLAANAADTPKEDGDFDLRFDPAAGKPVKSGGQELEVVRFQREKDGSCSARASIQSFDFGGHADLVVTAELDAGRIVYGELKDTREGLIPIPKRRPGSFISEAWRKNWHLDAPDSGDDDREPEGDGNLGDGYSNYEEYRGFVINGRHVRTRPDQKDLLIVNRLGDVALEGIDRFRTATGLHVLARLLPEELTADRVANPNRPDKSPRVAREYQHGIEIDLRTERDGRSMAMIVDEAKPWRPKNLERVTISADLLIKSHTEQGRSRIARTIAHELSHACGVKHHGDGDLRWKAFMRVTPRGLPSVVVECDARVDEVTGDFVAEAGRACGNVRILKEDDGREIPPDSGLFDRPWFAYVGVNQGEHSGNANCLMRYTVAQWYVPEASPIDRVLFTEPNPIGTELCPRPAAEGIWKKRFGDAARGDCRHRLAVRDDAPNTPGSNK